MKTLNNKIFHPSRNLWEENGANKKNMEYHSGGNPAISKSLAFCAATVTVSEMLNPSGGELKRLLLRIFKKS